MTEIMQRPGKVAAMLNVSGMTLRNYSREFDPYLSDHAKKKTGRKFTEQDIKVLLRASNLLRDGYTYEQTRELLADAPLEGEVFEGEIPPFEEPQPEQIPPAANNQTSAIEVYEQFFKPALDAKDDHIADLQKEIKWLRTPWWQKIFKDPPE